MPSLPDLQPVSSQAKVHCESGHLEYDRSCPFCYAGRGRLRYHREVPDKNCSVSFDFGGPYPAAVHGGEKYLLVGVLAARDMVVKVEEHADESDLADVEGVIGGQSDAEAIEQVFAALRRRLNVKTKVEEEAKQDDEVVDKEANGDADSADAQAKKDADPFGEEAVDMEPLPMDEMKTRYFIAFAKSRLEVAVPRLPLREMRQKQPHTLQSPDIGAPLFPRWTCP